MQVSKQRLLEIAATLELLEKSAGGPEDGLGFYMHGDIRSRELLSIIHGTLSMIDLAESQLRFEESLAKLKAGATSDLDPDLLRLASEILEEKRQGQLQPAKDAGEVG